ICIHAAQNNCLYYLTGIFVLNRKYLLILFKMLKRTYGRLLLTLLVATGLAGKVNDTSLSKSERKFLVTQYKETRAALFSKTKDLSTAQLKFRPAPDKWTIEEC